RYLPANDSGFTTLNEARDIIPAPKGVTDLIYSDTIRMLILFLQAFLQWSKTICYKYNHFPFYTKPEVF
ncbi:MAG: hypothetical protein AAF655_26425, partial [Bacteroidota bacterium]